MRDSLDSDYDMQRCDDKFYRDPGTKKCQSCLDICDFKRDHSLSRDCKDYCYDEYLRLMGEITTSKPMASQSVDPNAPPSVTSNPLFIALMVLLTFFVTVFIIGCFIRRFRPGLFNKIAASPIQIGRKLGCCRKSVRNTGDADNATHHDAPSRQISDQPLLGNTRSPVQDTRLAMENERIEPAQAIQMSNGNAIPNGRMYRGQHARQHDVIDNNSFPSNPARGHHSDAVGYHSTAASGSQLQLNLLSGRSEPNSANLESYESVAARGPYGVPTNDDLSKAKLTTGQPWRQSIDMTPAGTSAGANHLEETLPKTVD